MKSKTDEAKSSQVKRSDIVVYRKEKMMRNDVVV